MAKPSSATSGNDTLSGLGRSGKLVGGNGDDTYIIDDAGDEVVERRNGGIDLVISSISYQLPGEVENLTLLDTADLWGYGNSLDNVITGNSGANELKGFAGNDRLIGGDGDDRLFGGDGDDTLIGGSGSNLLDGGAGDDLAIFAGLSTDYSFELRDGYFWATRETSSGVETDRLANVEWLQFDDGPLTTDALLARTPEPDPVPVNSAPVAMNDSAGAVENTAVVIHVLSNDSDPDGDALTVASCDGVSAMGGSVSVNADGTVAYTPAAGFIGTDSFIYTASDGKGGSATANVTVTVDAPPDPNAVPYYVEGLISGEPYRLNYPDALGTGTVVTYAFLTAFPEYYGADEATQASFVAFSDQQEQVTRDFLALIESFTGLTFVETSEELAGMTFGLADLGGFNGMASKPNGDGVGSRPSDVWVDADYAGSVFLPHTNPYVTLLHEIGHAVGLEHPDLPVAEENQQYTVMDRLGHPTMSGEVTGYQLYDIAALQYLYGANAGHASGDDVYAFAEFDGLIKTIWDGGGNDTLDFSAATYAVKLDLNEGAFSTVAASGSNNVAIALNTVIEDAIGGAYADRIIGNEVDNRLTGGGGADVFGFAADWGDDIINDFVSGEDRLDFSAAGIGYSDLTITTSNGDTVIAYGDDSVTLFGVQTIDQGDFLVV